ncbi:metal-dependent hydrolase [Sphingorhabdus sp.]|uniref:metal-dependent hydrolase n=1 Tax=Sphingorhabdus sp. TaxID=1902408 RepID=UPI0039833C2C
MDNLTHSLVGALLGQIGLKRKTGLAMPTLIIAANIPDIDAVATLLGGQEHLALRRGITHGPIAMFILPLLLWVIMLWFDNWQAKRGKRPEKRLPVHKGWLLALAYIGCLSHPLFDWFNSYGIRLLEPFSSQWFYGDTLFIIDIWLWVALIAGVWVSLRRERKSAPNWRLPAFVSFAAISAYIFANGLITGRIEANVATTLRSKFAVTPGLVVANPVPFQFWRRDIEWRGNGRYGKGRAGYGFDGSYQEIEDNGSMHRADLKPKVLALGNSDAKAFLFWSRMPVIKTDKGGKNIILSDQRFSDPLVADRFTVTLPLKADSK